MIKYISFDLDGTLVDENKKFNYQLWGVEIPRIYAIKNKIPLKQAKQKIFSEYYSAKFIENISDRQWTRVSYWLKRLKIERQGDDITYKMKKHVKVKKSTVEVLKKLSKKYNLIIITASEPRFFKIKLKTEGIEKYFTGVFSMDSMNLESKNKNCILKY